MCLTAVSIQGRLLFQFSFSVKGCGYYSRAVSIRGRFLIETLRYLFQPEQLEEIKDIVDMKVAHRKNINKRKEKFGYESNSLIGLTMSAVEVLEAEAEEEAEAY